MKVDSTPDTKVAKQGCCCANKSFTPIRVMFKRHPHNLPILQLKVEEASCGGCVKSIEQTLGSVNGVEYVSMDLASGILSVIGTVQKDDLIAALERVGFPATVVD